jgi:hypothetical protein
MKDFQDAAWIGVERRRITVLDEVALRRLAQLRV